MVATTATPSVGEINLFTERLHAEAGVRRQKQSVRHARKYIWPPPDAVPGAMRRLDSANSTEHDQSILEIARLGFPIFALPHQARSEAEVLPTCALRSDP